MAKFERKLGFVLATNSPFAFVENKEFVSLLQETRPGIQVPGRRALGGRILDVVYEEWSTMQDNASNMGTMRN